MKKVLLAIIIVIMSAQPVMASIDNDIDVYYKKGNTYYLMGDTPPIRYGRAFGTKKDYVSCQNKKLMFSKTWKKKSAKAKAISMLINFIKNRRFVGLGSVVDLIRDNVRGVKIERTTFYNKHTKKFKVAKNKKCRKEIWIVSLKVKKGNRFVWEKSSSHIGYNSRITM